MLSRGSGCNLESLSDYLLWLYTDQTIDELTISEDQQCGDARDLKARSQQRVLVNIHFNDSIAALRLRGQLIQNRCDHPAWTTPRRPAIDEHCLPFCLYDLAVKCLVGNNEWRRVLLAGSGDGQLFTAAPALHLARRRPVFVNPILRPAIAANNNLHKLPLSTIFVHLT